MQHSPCELDGGMWCDSSSFSSSTMKVNLSQTNKGWIDKMVKHLFQELYKWVYVNVSLLILCVQNAPDSAELPDFLRYANTVSELVEVLFFLYIPANGCKRPTRPVLVLFLLLLVFLPFLLHACQLAQLFMSCYGHKSPPFAPPPPFFSPSKTE